MGLISQSTSVPTDWRYQPVGSAPQCFGSINMTLKAGLLCVAYHGFDPQAAMSLRPRDICARITALSSFVTHNVTATDHEVSSVQRDQAN